MNAGAIDEAICALLRDEAPIQRISGDDPSAVAGLLARSDYHGVSGLLNQRCSNSDYCAASIRDALRLRAIAAEFWDLRHREALGGLLESLARRHIRPVLFKGTALAYSHYHSPGLRSRADTDMIVELSDVRSAGEALVECGFKLVDSAGGEIVSSQASYILADRRFGDHSIDLHWKISNSAMLSKLFSYEELRATATALPSLHPLAISVSPVNAMMLACLHRAVHRQIPYYVNDVAHFGGDRFIWAYDILLLGRSFSEAQWTEFLREASARGLCAICLDGLHYAESRLGLHIPEFVRQELKKVGEPVDAYLTAGRLRQNWFDFTAIPSWSERLIFSRELMFPGERYMRAKYAGSRVGWMPWLYARRAFEGVLKRMSSAR